MAVAAPFLPLFIDTLPPLLLLLLLLLLLSSESEPESEPESESEPEPLESVVLKEMCAAAGFAVAAGAALSF